MTSQKSEQGDLFMTLLVSLSITYIISGDNILLENLGTEDWTKC